MAGDPNSPLRIRDDATADELRTKIMKHLGILIDGGVIDLDGVTGLRQVRGALRNYLVVVPRSDGVS
jgi:hypothetical protein